MGGRLFIRPVIFQLRGEGKGGPGGNQYHKPVIRLNGSTALLSGKKMALGVQQEELNRAADNGATFPSGLYPHKPDYRTGPDMVESLVECDFCFFQDTGFITGKVCLDFFHGKKLADLFRSAYLFIH